MFMGWFKIPSSETLETLKILDTLSPRWVFANEDSAVKRARLISRHIDGIERGFDYEEHIWIMIPNIREATDVQSAITFEEFGHAVWDDNRQIKAVFAYSGNGNGTIRDPGYVIAY